MLADLLGSDISLISQRISGDKNPSKKIQQRKEDLNKWRREHKSKVREKYRQEIEGKRKPETRPFSSERHLVSLISSFAFDFSKNCTTNNI